MDTSKRIAVVANKWWEANPLCAVLVDERARPPQFHDFSVIHYPTFRSPKPSSPVPDPPPLPRLSFLCGDVTVDIWCIEELMNPAVNSSSSLEKARVIPPALRSRPKPDLVIAFGTAGSRPGVAANGSVVIGRRVFIHDPRAGETDRTGLWTPPFADQVVDSPLDLATFRGLSAEFRYSAEARLLQTPIATATPPLVLAGNGFVSLGVVNITDYDQYAWADAAGIKAFNAAEIQNGQIGSIETTHGVIRSVLDAPFLFVSGIVDMDGVFDYQVTPRVYGQNVVGAHNAAVALSWFLPVLAAVI